MGYLSSVPSTFISSAALFSSLRGLGSLGYLSSVPSTFISSAALFSSLRGLGSLGYLSSVPSTFISSAALFSSLEGLGSLGYLSSVTLFSAITNLGQIYNSTIFIAGSNITFSSNGNQITINGQASNGMVTLNNLSSIPSTYISSASLFSSITGLGTIGYLSSYLSSFFTFSVQRLNVSSGIFNNINTGIISLSSIRFSDRNNSSTSGLVFQSSSLLFYNSSIIAGTSAMNIQTFIF